MVNVQIPLRRLSVVKLELFCQYLNPDCLQARQPPRVIGSQPCPRLSGEVYFEQGCHHSQSKPNKGSIYSLKYIGLYFFSFVALGIGSRALRMLGKHSFTELHC